MTTPVVPPRPQRSQAAPATSEQNDTPTIPPRPVRKHDLDDDRELYTRSPLNSLPGAAPPVANARPETDLPRRPPSVAALPGIGQEGLEYASYDQLPQEAMMAQKSVSADLPMHQPTASVPQSTASRQIQTVTRTDSATAAAAGIGRTTSGEESIPLARTTSNTAGGRRAPSVEPHPLRAQASFNRSSSSFQPLERTTSRPGSVHGENHEQGIPEIGRQIPLYKNAGDVQAPSPAPGQTVHTPGIGFFNDGSSKNHNRKRSTRQEFGPPDSYGLRHDHDHQDQFERAWQAKHPEEAAKEEYHLHVPRPPTALTSEQLNRLVDQTNPALDASRAATGTPDEEDVLDAAEEFNARRSPLKSQDGANGASLRAPSEAGADDNVVHVYRNMSRRTSRISIGSVDHLHEPGHVDHGYGSDRDMPILAADEVIKRPNSAYMHAAVNVSDAALDEYEGEYGHPSLSRHNSAQPASRPGSSYGAAPQKPLTEIEEYDPLFPDDDDGKSKPKNLAVRRPDLSLMHHFPSRDTWEDTPDSLQYSAEVSTPDIEREQPEAPQGTATAASATFETPEAEAQRIAQNPDTMLSDRKTFIKPNFKTGSREHLHGVPRFPSSDVWEDTPDSMRLETTVNAPQMDDTRAAPEDRPTTNVIMPEGEPHARASTNLGPTVPARPERPSKPADSTKPSIPARPVRAGQTADAGAPAKVKPALPARPGDKFNAGFLSDLNNRLKLGPQAIPAKKEPETDAAVAEEPTPRAPLADARKGRAKGPMRRKPGATTELKSASFALSPLITVWSIDEEDELQVESEMASSKPEPAADAPAAAAPEHEEAAEPEVPAIAVTSDA